MGPHLIGFAGGALVGALIMALWVQERGFRETGRMNAGIFRIARHLRLRDSAPVRTICENCGQATLTACTVPFISTNSQN